MSYERRVDRNNPGALIFMIDQSASMNDAIPGADVPKSAVLAEQVNGLLFELVQRCTKSIGEPPRPYFAVGVVGYGTDPSGNPIVGSQFSGDLAGKDWVWTSDLATSPLRIETRQSTDGDGREYRMPIWVDAFANGGTPMCRAFDLVGRMLKPWCDGYPDAFPPVVINLTDGEATDGDPIVWAERIRSLRTNDGNVLLFNLEIGSGGQPHAFLPYPPQDSQYSATLWQMSSELPQFMGEIATAQGFQIAPGARGFAGNADFRSVVSFLNVGTSIGQLLR